MVLFSDRYAPDDELVERCTSRLVSSKAWDLDFRTLCTKREIQSSCQLLKHTPSFFPRHPSGKKEIEEKKIGNGERSLRIINIRGHPRTVRIEKNPRTRRAKWASPEEKVEETRIIADHVVYYFSWARSIDRKRLVYLTFFVQDKISLKQFFFLFLFFFFGL